jgi:hypothetical protein
MSTLLNPPDLPAEPDHADDRAEPLARVGRRSLMTMKLRPALAV